VDTGVAARIDALHEMTVKELRRRWAEVFGEEAPNGHKKYLLKRLAWRIQANAEGDISERARRRAKELADDSDLRVKAPRAASRRSGNGTTMRGNMARTNDLRIALGLLPLLTADSAAYTAFYSVCALDACCLASKTKSVISPIPIA